MQSIRGTVCQLQFCYIGFSLYVGMVKSLVLVFVLLMILHASQLASSADKARSHCSPNCPVCYKDNRNCPGIVCQNPGNCTSFTRDSCGCCLRCVKLEGESCGGLYGAAGFCANNLRCTVSENRALSGKNRTVGICKGN